MSAKTKEVSKVSLYLAGLSFTLCVGFSFFGIKQCVPYGDTLIVLAYRYAAALISVIMLASLRSR